MEYVDYLFKVLNSPYGGALVSAFFGLVAQQFSYNGLALITETSKKLDEWISEGIGYIVTIAGSLALFFVVNKDIKIFIFNLSLAFALHILYARFVLPWLKKRAKNKS